MDKVIWNPSTSATIAAMSIRCHIRATKVNRTPNLKEQTSVVRMRQHRVVVVGHHWWTHGNNRPRTARISTNSGSQEAAIVRRTPAAPVTITPGRPLSLATFPSSSLARYSSPLGVPSTTTSGIRSSSPPGELSTRGTASVRHVINSRGNTVTGVEGEIPGIAKNLMLQYTIYVNPLRNPLALASEVHSVGSRAQDEIADAGNMEPSSKSIDILSQRSQP